MLFSVFHHAVMLTFRARRAEEAEKLQATPGITCFKVDGRLTRTGRARHSSRGVQEVTVGDVEFADDTALLGQVDELVGAEKVFVQTLRDWEQQEQQGKREKLVISPAGDATTACLINSRPDCSNIWVQLTVTMLISGRKPKNESKLVFSQSNALPVVGH